MPGGVIADAAEAVPGGLNGRQVERPRRVRDDVPWLANTRFDGGPIIQIVRPYLIGIRIRMVALVVVGRVETPQCVVCRIDRTGQRRIGGALAVTERTEAVAAEE